MFYIKYTGSISVAAKSAFGSKSKTVTITNTKTYTVSLSVSAWGEEVNSKTFDLSQYVSDWKHISRLYIDSEYLFARRWVEVSLKDPNYTFTVKGLLQDTDNGLLRGVNTETITKIEVKY